MEIKKKDIEDLIEKLQNLVDIMDDYEKDSVPVKVNTYGIHNFIAFGNKGYLPIEEDYEYLTKIYKNRKYV